MALDYALSEARMHPYRGELRASLCAVLVTPKGEQFVGFNKKKSHPLQKEFGRNAHSIFLHAEIDALVHALRKNSNWDLLDSSIYVARALKDGSPALAKPCVGCMKALYQYGITDIHWTH